MKKKKPDPFSSSFLDTHVNITNEPCDDEDRQHPSSDCEGFAQSIQGRVVVGDLKTQREFKSKLLITNRPAKVYETYN